MFLQVFMGMSFFLSVGGNVEMFLHVFMGMSFFQVLVEMLKCFYKCLWKCLFYKC